MVTTNRILESDADLCEARTYWHKTLKGFIAATPLGVEQKEISQPDERVVHGSVKTPLRKETANALRKLELDRGIDVETLIHGAWAVLLSRYLGETEVLFGSMQKIDAVVKVEGITDATNLPVPLKIEVDSGAHVDDWMKRLQAQLTDLSRHGSVSLGQLKTWGAIIPGHSLLASSIVCGEAADALTHPEGSASLLQLCEEISCPLVLLALTRERLELELFYRQDRFSEDVIQRMSGHLVTLLEGIVANPEQCLSELPLLTASELQLLAQWNDTTRKYPQQVCMHELFERQAERTPEAAAVLFHEAQVSYGELNRRANQLANYLRRAGVGPEVRVGILLERSVEMIVSLLGVLKAGGAYVPFDPQYPAERLAFMIEDAELEVLITQESLRGRLADTAASKVIVVEQEAWNGESTANVESGVREENLAYLIYTSGSTGRPKGVAIEHRNAVTLIHWAREIFSADELQGMLASTSICFDLSVFELFVPLSWGGRIILAAHHLALASMAHRAEVRLINTGPCIITELLRLQAIPAETRVVNLAGEALRRPLVDQLYELSTIERVVNLYGPSEDTTYSTWAVMQRRDASPVPIGRPVANTRVYVVDKRGLPLPIGVAGELWLGGEGVARGYFGRAVLTAEKFIPDGLSGQRGARLYRTGDLVRYLPDGNIEYLGRVDQQVKIRGIRVELGEIEAALLGHPSIQEAVVLFREYRPSDNRLVAYVSPEWKDVRQLNKELQNYLREKLPKYMVPTTFVALPALPLNPNGKVDRKALPVTEFGDQKVDYVAPRTPIEESLASIWSEVLGLDHVGVDDDFFSLGGQSLLATMVITRVRQSLKIELPQRIFFEAPTVARLAQRVEDIKRWGHGLKSKSRHKWAGQKSE